MTACKERRLPCRRAYLRALYGRLKGLVRRMLGLKRRPVSPVLAQPISHIINRHSWICSVLREHLPPDQLWAGARVCEAGAGDCLAAASMLLGLGASHVVIVEHEQPILGSKQASVLRGLRNLGYPCDEDILDSNHLLNSSKCSYIESYMENYTGHADCSFLYSICVGEHVEDLEAFFKSCYDTLAKGSSMMHYIDLGGHGIFEDPVLPLEFHRYGRIAYDAIFPRYSRATRRFVSDYIRAASACGFNSINVKATRIADSNYVTAVLPHLKAHAVHKCKDELAIIEFILYATK